MPLKPSHNLLVRGSNPCGGTKDIADFRFWIADFAFREFPSDPATHEGASSNKRGTTSATASSRRDLMFIAVTDPEFRHSIRSAMF